MAINQTLTGNGSTARQLVANGQRISLGLSGTFVATATLERSEGGQAWVPVASFTAGASVLARAPDSPTGDAWYRVTVSEFVSGSVVVALDAVTVDGKITVSWNDIEGKPTIPTIPAKMPGAEATTGTATTQRTIDAATLKTAVNAHDRLTDAQRTAINALVSPTADYADLTEATAAIKAIIDALQAT